MKDSKIEACRALVQRIYSQFDASHDFTHIERVVANGVAIAAQEQHVDLETLQLALYLHDVSDAKYAENDAELQHILQQLGLDEQQRAHVLHIIEAVSFNGGHEVKAQTIEAKIARDADRLDAIGAIGIARAFAFGGAKGRQFYDDTERVSTYETKDAYHATSTATVTHFYEKLLTLQDRMCTKTGRQMATQRHLFMEQFLSQLAKEREGLT